ncbi:MAG: EamA family transporter, partial [Pseudomonadota bacterium]|nr:EamA family transporter [Pseudomonadota bacterium]
MCARLAFLLNEAAMLPSAPRDPEAVKGVMFGLTAYTMWGCFPLFFALF